MLAAAAVVVVARRGGGDDDAPPRPERITRRGSVAVAGAPPVEITRTPASFRVEYRLEEVGDGEVTVSTDVVSVRRPWDSRLETFEGEGTTGERLSLQVAAFASRTTRSAEDEASTVRLTPGVPASDVRLAGVLAMAIEHGLVHPREVRRVAGRLCRVYRTGTTLSATVFTAPTAGDYGDNCVDEAGLVLEEALFVGGRLVLRRVAVSVEEGVDLGDDLFAETGAVADVRSGGGQVRRLKDGTSPPGEVLVLPAAPAGFVHEGRYSVVPSQPENFSGDPARAGLRRAGVADVWVRGVDVLVIEQGGTLYGADPFTVDESRPSLALGPLGRGEVLLGGLGAEVRALLGGGRYLRVTGTLTPPELADLAATLQRMPGGTALEFDEEDE